MKDERGRKQDGKPTETDRNRRNSELRKNGIRGAEYERLRAENAFHEGKTGLGKDRMTDKQGNESFPSKGIQ